MITKKYKKYLRYLQWSAKFRKELRDIFEDVEESEIDKVIQRMYYEGS